MGVLASLGAATGAVTIAGSTLSLASATKSLVSGKKLPPGIAGFLFDIPESVSVNYTAQITDHYVEDNSAIQDHVSIDPIKISMTGKIAELVYTKTQAAAYAESVLNGLASLKVLSPAMSQAATEHISQAEQLNQAANQVLKQAGTLTGLLGSSQSSLNAQQKAYTTFKTLFLNRSLLTVETPFETFENMIIESFDSVQDEDTVTVSTFTVNFKQIRTVSVTVGVGNLVGRIKQQKSQVVNKGTQPGQSIGAASLDGIKSAFGSLFK